MNFGFAITATNYTWAALRVKLGSDWDKDEGDQRLSLMDTLATAGLAVSCLFSGPLIARGRRKVVMAGNLVVVIGCCVCTVENFLVIGVGRVITGLGAGLAISAAPKIIEESIP